ncbi:DNA-directed RNA polymerase subunit beta [Abeliophyllum distichum]|uniref:DNA-directed RNA polymerase subunit beta n=1 Tax=Abeliophyllum distichum TaxID=126358 RepID=A0ABD1PQI8_9LAMI
MGALDAIEEVGPSSLSEKFSNDPFTIDINVGNIYCDDSDSDDDAENYLQDHQINSFNDFIKHGIQQMFDSIGEIVVEPDYDPSKRKDDDGFKTGVEQSLENKVLNDYHSDIIFGRLPIMVQSDLCC